MKPLAPVTFTTDIANEKHSRTGQVIFTTTPYGVVATVTVGGIAGYFVLYAPGKPSKRHWSHDGPEHIFNCVDMYEHILIGRKDSFNDNLGVRWGVARVLQSAMKKWAMAGFISNTTSL